MGRISQSKSTTTTVQPQVCHQRADFSYSLTLSDNFAIHCFAHLSNRNEYLLCLETVVISGIESRTRKSNIYALVWVKKNNFWDQEEVGRRKVKEGNKKSTWRWLAGWAGCGTGLAREEAGRQCGWDCVWPQGDRCTRCQCGAVVEV